MNKRLLATLLCIFLVIIVGSFFDAPFNHPQASPASFKVGIATWSGFSAAFVATDKHLCPDIKIVNLILDDAPARHAAFQSGDIDIMISSVDVFAQEAAQGIKGRIFLVTDESFGGDGIIAKPEIKSIEDLRGKKIAFARATPSHFFLYKVLKDHGLSPSDIQQVAVDDPGNAAQAFLGGSVDAAVTWEPFVSEVKEKGNGNVLITTKDYPGSIVDVMVASEKLSKDPELLRRFTKCWLDSVDYILKNPEESAKIISKGLNTKDQDIKDMMAGLRFADSSRNHYFFDTENIAQSKIAGIFQEAGAFWKLQGIISAIPNANSAISQFSSNYFSDSTK